MYGGVTQVLWWQNDGASRNQAAASSLPQSMSGNSKLAHDVRRLNSPHTCSSFPAATGQISVRYPTTIKLVSTSSNVTAVPAYPQNVHFQIDEPVLVRSPDKALAYGIDHLRRCFEGVPPSTVKGVHLCCGYPTYLVSTVCGAAIPVRVSSNVRRAGVGLGRSKPGKGGGWVWGGGGGGGGRGNHFLFSFPFSLHNFWPRPSTEMCFNRQREQQCPTHKHNFSTKPWKWLSII